jgi:transposase
MGHSSKYPPELIERGVRLVLESGKPVSHIASSLGIRVETLRRRVRQAEADREDSSGVIPSAVRQRVKELEKENFELKRANEILKAASVFFAKEIDDPRKK